jgi:RNA polymerase sigma-70 factor (ECF subfamily)
VTRLSDHAEGEFSRWYESSFPRVRAAISLACGDWSLGEEATAEAFARALLRWPALAAAGRPDAWVYVVALNLVRTQARRSRLERRHLASQREQHQEPPSEPDDALWRAVAALPPRSRTAIALRYVADLSEAEMADAMHISRGTVAATLHKARKRLGEDLAAHREPQAPRERTQS